MRINGNNNKSLLRFTTAGSVDDGKSTLIGRLLFDSKSIFEDQMDHIVESSRRLGKEDVDLSLLTDGLRAEREQGITIDVAYRYFATPRRKFIIADTPGHIQYTRNMVTGASTADVAVILVDARSGPTEQTLRHAYIASLLDIRHIIFCINKMDLVDYSEIAFMKFKARLSEISGKLGVENSYYVPISAKWGDNVVDRSVNMNWYDGKTFLDLIETIEIAKNYDSSDARFPVQTVIRPLSHEFHDYRGYAGRIAGGRFRIGDEILVLPSNLKSRIRGINCRGKDRVEATAGDSVSFTIEDQISISRGDLIVKPESLPESDSSIELMVCWFNEKPLTAGSRYLVRNHTSETNSVVLSVNYKVDINTLETDISDLTVRMNDISNVTLKTSGPLFFDSYRKNHITGSIVFIDEGTNETAGAGMIV